MSRDPNEVIESMLDEVEAGSVEGLDKLSEEEARMMSIEAFINSMLAFEDNPKMMNEIAFRTLAIMAFGAHHSAEPDQWTDFLIDCIIVAPNNAIKVAIREVAGTVFKGYLITMAGDDVLTPIMEAFVTEAGGSSMSDDRRTDLEDEINNMIKRRS